MNSVFNVFLWLLSEDGGNRSLRVRILGVQICRSSKQINVKKIVPCDFQVVFYLVAGHTELALTSSPRLLLIRIE